MKTLTDAIAAELMLDHPADIAALEMDLHDCDENNSPADVIQMWLVNDTDDDNDTE